MLELSLALLRLKFCQKLQAFHQYVLTIRPFWTMVLVKVLQYLASKMFWVQLIVMVVVVGKIKINITQSTM